MGDNDKPVEAPVQTPEKPSDIPTGNPGTRDNQPRPQTGDTSAPKE